ncbi:MAG: PQQ-binding-like beta-propeller repeat protein [Acidobacteria bacterium]|nr:PQQ-binding-like beta-propeller repeat protein [Acidobacteriota bacterium]
MQNLLVAALVTLLSTPVLAQEWPQFRGPGALGVANDPRLPDTWSATENVVWTTAVPGTGWSSPVIWNDAIFMTSVVRTAEGEPPRPGLYLGGERGTPRDLHRWMLYAVDWNTGDIRWERELHASVPEAPRHLKNSYASETPVTDGERVYAYFGQIGIFAFDIDGTPLWSQQWEPFRTRNGWGTAASPVLHNDRLYIVNDNDDQSFLLALDKRTGEPIWRIERNEGTNWSTPYVWKNSKRTEIVTTGSDKVRSYAESGALLWELTGMSTITIPTPLATGDLLYISSGYVGDPLRPAYAIRPGATGDISLRPGEQNSTYIAWAQLQAASYNPSPIVYGDYYYTLFDRGFLTAHDARSGREVYDKVRIEIGAAFTSSPWAYNGKIFALSEEGDTFVFRAGPKYELLGKNSLDEMCLATPAIARSSLIIRTASRLYRITKSTNSE